MGTYPIQRHAIYGVSIADKSGVAGCNQMSVETSYDSPRSRDFNLNSISKLQKTPRNFNS